MKELPIARKNSISKHYKRITKGTKFNQALDMYHLSILPDFGPKYHGNELWYHLSETVEVSLEDPASKEKSPQTATAH
jgi:hypothetical protein